MIQRLKDLQIGLGEGNRSCSSKESKLIAPKDEKHKKREKKKKKWQFGREKKFSLCVDPEGCLSSILPSWSPKYKGQKPSVFLRVLVGNVE
jgi:hypothetical protein